MLKNPVGFLVGVVMLLLVLSVFIGTIVKIVAAIALLVVAFIIIRWLLRRHRRPNRQDIHVYHHFGP